MVKTAEERQAVHRAFIKEHFSKQWNLTVASIELDPRAQSNFVYHITLEHPVEHSGHLDASHPGTSELPSGTTRLIFRVPSPDVPFNQSVRIQNAVAAADLMRQALTLDGLSPALVPSVYAWDTTGPDADGVGWIVEQHMQGLGNQDFLFNGYPRDRQHAILQEMAGILAALQRFQLPESCKGYGSLAYNETGEIVTVPIVVEPYSGPYDSFQAFYIGMLDEQLKEADRSPLAAGWREGGIRDRIEQFKASKFQQILSEAKVDAERCLIHGDFNIGNFLFDESTYKITAIIDLDCSHIHHPLHEYFFSFDTLNYILGGPFHEEQTAIDVRNALLHGFPNPLPASKEPDLERPQFGAEMKPQWEVMKLFEAELERAGAARPSTIAGAEQLSELYAFMSCELCPWFFNSERFLSRRTEEQKLKLKKSTQETIEQYLKHWGF